MKEYFKTIPATTIIIIYLYLCGGLYLIAFWSTFSFDVSNIVSLADIPKNFIFPFILSNIFFILQTGISLLTEKKVYEEPFNEKKYNRTTIVLDFLLIGTLGLITSFYFSYKSSGIFWLVSCTLLIILLVLKFESNLVIKKNLPTYKLRYYLSTIIITVPLFCILTAKLKSLSIFNNNDISYIKIKNLNETISDTTSLKLLGFIGDKIIVSSLDNKKIVVLTQSSFNAIEIVKNSK